MKKNNKGFTLVELIVVLVILAILAAILVPALLGYIDKAREGQYAEEAHSILVAAQGFCTEKYATDATKASPTIAEGGAMNGAAVTYINNIVTPTSVTKINSVTWRNSGATDKDKYTIAGLSITFTSQNGSKSGTMIYSNGAWTISPDDTFDD
jgi:prepilin-type N-terminal cleavage/methylation domain